jgi:group I intron endonuclease
MKICGIYKITSPSKKIYIGQSIDIMSRWRSYKNMNCKDQGLLYRSLHKYGSENHLFEVICRCNRNELNELEQYYISLYQTFNTKYGLNLASGGTFNCSYTEETRKKQSEKKKGLTSPMKGKKHSKESLEKMRIASIGNTHMKGYKFSDESKKKLSKSHTGLTYVFSEQHKLNMSKAKKKEWEQGTRKSINGENNPFYGKKHSPEIMARIIDKTKGRHLSPSSEFKKGMTSPIKGKKKIVINNVIKYI